MTVTRAFAAGCADAGTAIARTAMPAAASRIATRRAPRMSGSRRAVFVVGWLGCIGNGLGGWSLGLEVDALFDVLLDLLLDLLFRNDLGDSGLRLLVLGSRSSGRLRLRRLERGQLLLRRQVAALR